MTTITLPPMPTRIAKLPRDDRGFPVPWFVQWFDGKPDFRIVDERRFLTAIQQGLCFLCGQQLRYDVHDWVCFPIGPMCVVNRISSEPPSCIECAQFAVKTCPFIVNPRMRRNEKDMPDGSQEAAGIMLKRNPGVMALWVTDDWTITEVPNGILFDLGDPCRILWYTQGREATPEEAIAAIDEGFPGLRALAEQDGPEAVAEIEAAYNVAMGRLR